MNESISQNANRKNLLQLVWLRLNAIFGQAFVILFAYYFVEISLPLASMFTVLGILALATLASFFRYKSQKNISSKSLFFELLFDVAALTAQLYFSGGSSNPFISLFLLQVIIGAILLSRIYAWLIAGITVGCYIWLSFFYQELCEFHHHDGGEESFNLHLHGMLLSYIFAAILLVIFITKIIKNLQERDRKIHFLKQQSLEKEQVFRMGLLACSAAHELGTPLSTIQVVLGDWKNLSLDAEMKKDVELVENQLVRCKKILSEILSSSKNARVHEARIIKAKELFEELISQWQTLRNPRNFSYKFFDLDEQKIISDNVLSHAFFSILDNAMEAAKQKIFLEISANKSDLQISVSDDGEGFAKEVISEIGKPNFTTKNGNGLGLFLAANSLSNIGGKLEISNLASGGAQVKITIPFA